MAEFCADPAMPIDSDWRGNSTAEGKPATANAASALDPQAGSYAIPLSTDERPQKDALAELLFNVYQQGYQSGSGFQQSDQHIQADYQHLRDNSKLPDNQATESLLTSWYNAGLTSGTAIN